MAGQIGALFCPFCRLFGRDSADSERLHCTTMQFNALMIQCALLCTKYNTGGGRTIIQSNKAVGRQWTIVGDCRSLEITILLHLGNTNITSAKISSNHHSHLLVHSYSMYLPIALIPLQSRLYKHILSQMFFVGRPLKKQQFHLHSVVLHCQSTQ